MFGAIRLLLRQTSGNVFRMVRNTVSKLGKKSEKLQSAGATKKAADGKVAYAAMRWKEIGENAADVFLVFTGIAGISYAVRLLGNIGKEGAEKVDAVGEALDRYALISLACGAGLIALVILTQNKRR